MKRTPWQLIALAVLFFGPFFAAIVLYMGRESIGAFDQVPNPDRELIENPATIPVEPLVLADGNLSEPAWARSRWSLIYARIDACEGRCIDSLTRLYQVWLALGGERDRVQLVVLAPAGGADAAAGSEFLVGVLDAPDGPALIDLLGSSRVAQGRYFVVDPLGNVILSYPDDADQSRLLDDLERLLDLSRVG
jgi:hypothetical protein